MSTTIVAGPATARPSWTHTTRLARIALIALAVVVLAATFVIARATAGSRSHGPAIAPTASVSGTAPSCNFGRAC